MRHLVQHSNISLITKLLLIAMFAVLIILIFSPPAFADQLVQINPSRVPLLRIQNTPSPSLTPSSNDSNNSNTNVNSSNPQVNQQILSEAQNDVNIANSIIMWSGLILAIVAAGVALAGFYGLREIRLINQLRMQYEAQVKKYESNIAKVESTEEQVELQLKELAIRFERESQTLIEASYNFGLATDSYKVGDNVRAIDYYLRVLKLQPNNIRVMERLGRAYTNLNEIKKAIQSFEQALRIDPKNVPALRGLSTSYRYIDIERAIAYVKQALELDPLDYDGWDYLGLLNRDKGLTDEAIAAHEKALGIYKMPETEFFLSILYSQKGDKEQAKLMALAAQVDSRKKEHAERVRPVWKKIMECGTCIIEGNEKEAIQRAEELNQYMTTERLHEAVMSHLTALLNATGHKNWIPKFENIVKIKEVQIVTT